MKVKIPKIYRFGIRFPWTVLLCSLLLAVFCFISAEKLKIQTDFESLLPQNNQSVQNLKQYNQDFGSMGFLVVTVESPEKELAEKFAEAMAGRIEKHPQVRYVNYRRPVDYFKDRQWLYLDIPDLQEMARRTDRSVELQRKGVSPVFNDLMDFADEENRPDLTFKDIRQKYEDKMGKDTKAVTSDQDGKFLVLWVKSKTDAGDVDANRKLIADIKGIESQLKQDPSFSTMKVGYTGEYETKIESVDSVKWEIFRVSGIVGGILFLILLFYFRRLSAALLVSFPLVIGIIWTNGFTYFVFGHVNMITAFCSAILAGLGSDYGIYLLSRYYIESDKGVDFPTACRLAFSNTGKATFGSMLTTVGAFGALIFSRFLVFREFGFVGAMGVFLNYLAMMLIIPSSLVLLKRVRKYRSIHWLSRWDQIKIPNLRMQSKFWERIFYPTLPRGVIGIFAALILLSGLTLPAKAKIYYEESQTDNRDLPGNKLYDRVIQVTGTTLTPTVLMGSGSEEEKRAVDHFNSQLDTQVSDQLVYNKIVGLSTFIPKEQTRKKEILEKLLQKFREATLVNKTEKEKILKSIQTTLAMPPVSEENLPKEVTRIFKAIENQALYAIYLFPNIDRNSVEGMRAYNDSIKKILKEQTLQFVPVDSSFVAQDILELIDKEASGGLLLVVLFLSGVIFFTIRPASRSVLIIVNLLASLVLLSGLLYLTKMQLNIMNIGVVPVILGTGIDCFIHFSHRYDESEDIEAAVKNQIPSILVSSLTSIVGFGGLILTSDSGLRSVGWMAVLGLCIVTVMCVVVFPRILVLQGQKNKTPLEEKKVAMAGA